MINLFFPFIFLSIISLLVSINFKINLDRSYLISSLGIPLFIFFIGNFISLYWAIYIIVFLILVSLIFKENYKRIFTYEILKKISLYFIIYFLIILYTTNFFLHKYDEFSEYGIVSKLIFFEEELVNNIHNIYFKASPHKINIMGYLNYFFLKTSLSEFKEQTLYIAQITLNVFIIINLLNFISNNKQKIIYFFILFFLCYVLSTGFDKLYLDTTAALLIGLIITNQFIEKSNSKYIIISLSMIFLFCLKPSATIIFLGLSGLFIFYYFLEKNFRIISIYFFLILLSAIVEKFYSYDLYLSEKNQNSESEYVYLQNTSHSHNYNKKISKLKNLSDINSSSNINYMFIRKNFLDLTEKGIYHSSTFLIFNKIFQRLNINLRLLEIPITLFFWIFLLIILIKTINLERKSKLILFVSFYILFIIVYWFIILYWGWQNNLVNEDLSIEVSWQRHLGAIILGILLYLLIILFQKNKLGQLQFFFIIIFIITISKPNSVRNFFPKEFIMKDNFWSKKYNQRKEISNLSYFINSNTEKYSSVVSLVQNENSYFLPILNYELIDRNLIKSSLNFLILRNQDWLINKYPLLKINSYFYILINNSNKEYFLKFLNSKNLKIMFKKDFQNKYAIYKINYK